MERKYNIRRKRLNIVREEMKQQMKAVGAKVKQFTLELTNDNRIVNNQGQFFQRLNNEEEYHQCVFQIL